MKSIRIAVGLLGLLIGMMGCDKGKSPAPVAKKDETVKAPPASQPSPASQPAASQPMKPMDEGASVFFVWPEPNSTVPTDFDVVFGIKGMSISKAGENLNDKTKGHHHLIIDSPFIKYGQVVPADEKHIHFGMGQTAARVKLSPGEHTLTMQLADGAHRSFGKALSAAMKVTAVALPKPAKVAFVEPADGATVSSPLKVKFAIEGMTISPAGQAITDKTKGHHHVIVDGQSLPAGTVVPADEKHIHFGKGQTEAELKLAPGKHTLTLQFADGGHRSYGPTLSQTISVTVK